MFHPCRWAVRLALACVLATPAAAQTPGGSATSTSLTNPAISVIGWLQAVAGGDPDAQERAFELREAEVAFQAAVDPFTRAEFYLAASEEGLEVEEGTITWLALPAASQLKAGRFRADFGKFNRTHPPEAPFADRPLAAAAFTGEEGLAVDGASFSILLPAPGTVNWEAVAQVGAPPDENPLFGAGRRSDLLGLARSAAFVPLNEAADLNLGASFAAAPAHEDLRAGEGAWARIAGGDVTFRWKNPRRSIYRSVFVQLEAMAARGSADGADWRSGTFAYAAYQFARQWTAGARWDWTEMPGGDAHASGALVLLQWRPSEFSTLSLQGRRVRSGGEYEDAAFLKWTFNIGPHGAHPY